MSSDMELQLQSLDYWAIGIYILLMAGIGLSFGWFIKDVGAYFKGNGTIPWLMATVTNFMGLFSTFVFVAYAGIAYEYGLVSITVFWSTVPACIIGGIWLGGRWRRTGCVTPIEYLEQRYSFSVREVMTWVGLLVRLLDNMVRLYAIGVFITVVTPLSLEAAIIISGAIVTLFNIIGGIWTVTIMSTVQFVILILITCVLLPVSLHEVGGIEGLYQQIPEKMMWFNGPKGAFFWLSVYYVMTLIKYNENWTFIQKFFCVKDEKAARKVGVVTGILFLVFTPIFLIPAVASSVIVPGLENTEMSYISVAIKLLPAGIMGIMFSSMFAATMSSLNAVYNVMSSVFTKDVYQRLFNTAASEKQLLVVARWSTLVIGVLIAAGAIYIQGFGGAFEANKLFTGIFCIPIGIPLVLGIVNRKPNAKAAIATISAGISAGIVLNALPSVSWESATLIELLLCLVLYYLPVYGQTAEKDRQGVGKLFEALDRSINAAELPSISPQYVKALVSLLLLSLIVSGGLFIGMSIPNLHSMGGELSLWAGTLSLLLAVALWVGYKNKLKSRK